MNGRWEITGEAGAQMGSNLLSLQALFPLVQELVFNSQAADTWGYFLPINADGSNSEYLPDRQQTVSLYRDGIRQFSGRVVSRKYIFNNTGQGWQIQIKGGWYELEKPPLISDTSATYDIAAGNLADSIRAVLQKAITEGGARLQIGDIAPMMDCFALQFRASTVAATVRDLLRFAQDAVTYVDYQSEGLPTLHIVRRSTAMIRTVTLGVDALTRCELSPNDEAAPDRVDFTYAVADSNGVVSQITQSAGADQPRNRLQVVTAATGFEDFQARAAQSQQTIKTVTLSGSLPLSFFIARDARLAELEAANAGVVSANLSSGTLSVSSPTWSGYTITSWTFPQSRRVVGTGSAPSLPHFIEKGTWQEWMAEKLGVASEEVQVEGTYWVAANKSFGFTAAQVELLQAMDLFYENAGFWYYRYKSIVTTRAISIAYPTDTVLRDPGDYSLVSPPSGIASFILAAMTEPAYDGVAEYDAYQPFARDLARAHNVIGGPLELLTAKALPKQERLNIQTGTRTLMFGSSSAGSGLDLMSRFRRLSAK